MSVVPVHRGLLHTRYKLACIRFCLLDFLVAAGADSIHAGA